MLTQPGQCLIPLKIRVKNAFRSAGAGFCLCCHVPGRTSLSCFFPSFYAVLCLLSFTAQLFPPCPWGLLDISCHFHPSLVLLAPRSLHSQPLYAVRLLQGSVPWVAAGSECPRTCRGFEPRCWLCVCPC